MSNTDKYSQKSPLIPWLIVPCVNRIIWFNLSGSNGTEGNCPHLEAEGPCYGLFQTYRGTEAKGLPV